MYFRNLNKKLAAECRKTLAATCSKDSQIRKPDRQRFELLERFAFDKLRP
jgi:hypothetical protein